MFISVVIPTRNRAERVTEAVRSVLSSRHKSFELFVVDQSDDSATHESLKEFAHDSRFRYVKNVESTSGPSSSRNIGIALSSGDVVANIDDDVTVSPDWLTNLASEFEADSQLQFVCGKLSAPSYDSNKGVVPVFDPEELAGRKPHWTMLVHTAGANYCMRRSLFYRLGGYHEAFGPGTYVGAADDGEIGLRIMRSGARWKASSSAEVVHTYGFRPTTAGNSLISGYGRGIGAAYGYAARRGDLIPALWFMQDQAMQIMRLVVPRVLLFRRPTGFGWIHSRLKGFWCGFSLNPGEGFVTPADLDDLRHKYMRILGRDLPQAECEEPALLA